MDDTIFALSSGAPPAGIGIIRISGPQAEVSLRNLARKGLPPRRANLVTLRADDGGVLDTVLALWLPGPGTATGEDTVEFHCHGGRAVIAAVLGALGKISGFRAAGPGEFTRRAFANGRIDLAEAEGLADLLSAETELQRQSALAMASGALSRQVDSWRDQVLTLSASVEAVLDFADDDVTGTLPGSFITTLDSLADEIRRWVEKPSATVLKDGFRVVIAGPPNAGKSTLFNCLVNDEAAIVSSVAGTTRDILQASVAYDGIAFTIVDTAGLRDDALDPIETIGIAKALSAQDRGDVVFWLGFKEDLPKQAWHILAQADRNCGATGVSYRHKVSAHSGIGMEELWRDLVLSATSVLPKPGAAAVNERQRTLLDEARTAIAQAGAVSDPLLIGESLRLARLSFDKLIGRATTEDMLDRLFSRFCIGK